MERWLPLFHDRMDTLLDYLPGAPVVLEHAGRRCGARAFRANHGLLRCAQDRAGRHGQRCALYKPLPPDRLYLAESRVARASGRARRWRG